jgi:hypothetical protein
MRTRLWLYVLLASTLTFFASLFLQWVESTPTAAAGTSGALSLLNLFNGVSFDGWGPYGQVAALVALALAATTGVSLLHPQQERRLPLASAGVALLYLALFNAAQTHDFGVFVGTQSVSVQLGPGAYLGIACAVVAFVATVGARWDELTRRPSALVVVALALTIGLLTAYILPWLQLPGLGTGVTAGATGYQFSNTPDTLTIFIALLACFALPLWGPRTPPGRRLAAALGLAVLVGGTLSYRGVHLHWPYEAWLQLGCSLGLVVLALATARGLRLSLLPVAEAAAAVAASLLVVSMFLPWQRVCGGGLCDSSSGWTLTNSSTAGGLAVIALVLHLGFQRLFVELAVAVAIYVLIQGFVITEFAQARVGYGAPLGFAGAALLLIAAARRLGNVPPDRKRVLLRFVPLIACLGFLAIPVVTMTGRLSQPLEVDSPWHWYWFELGAIIVALRLLGRWLGGPRADDELVLLPLALLVLTVLDVFLAHRAFGTFSWESWVSTGLCVLLAVFGWLERIGRLENLRVPEEIWRVDRLPGES